ncbi:hypothetical protein BD309DRAFT_1081608 [Dichomitus squalens]|uniref:Uncharacterized protein n=1 Tax=Dichomitus squalens TaxID=114155 RepID=A0A4Q9Q290_9APHY|nr:hypothetical protein BD309DRAFT_1081608 [Dichomitus squalens]TBU61353.1 hypothetical protein BD310DRAFT_220597 [Dichomitus squalens]
MSSVCLPEPIQGAIHGGELPAGTAALSPTLRPIFIRRETDQILSYYQSEHAGRTYDFASAEPGRESQHNTQEQQQQVTPSLPLSTTIPRPRGIRRESTASSTSDYSSHYSSSDDEDSHQGPAAAHVFPHAPASSQSPERSTPRTSAETRSDKLETQRQSQHSAGTGARHSRRISTPSEGGADRRRLAIVEMDATTSVPPMSIGRKRSKGLDRDGKSADSSSSPTGGSGMSTGTLFSRRGVHIGGLALVAPPDASPRTYTDLTPPSTAPVSSGSAALPPPSAFQTHTRSASEAFNAAGSRSRLHHKSSRDVGIVGLSSASTASESLSPASPTSDEYHVYTQSAGLRVPIFQTPAKSRSPSPGGTTPELSDTSSAGAIRSAHQRLLSTPIFGMEDGIITPGIGEGKDIGQPVVGPVIVGLSPSMLQPPSARSASKSAATHGLPSLQSPASSSPSCHSSPSSSSPYLHYQPGVHSTAGPLPPPPRSIFEKDNAPPRPPRYHTPLPNSTRRDIDAIKEALQLPQSVSAKLAARTPLDVDKQLGREQSPSRADSSRETQSEESTYSEEPESSVRLVSSKPVHVREGAFPPSKIISTPSGKASAQLISAVSEEQPASSDLETRPFVVIEQEEPEDEPREPEARRPGIELRRESSWVSLSQEATLRPSSPNGKSTMLPILSVSRSPSFVSAASSSSSVSHLPSLPPKSIRNGSDDEKRDSALAPSSFKALTNFNLKRFSSLPRTPSRSSRSSKRSSSPDPHRSLSPPPPPSHDYQHTPILIESPPRRRIIPKVKYSHFWPPAMNAADIVVLRSSRERAKGYAMKINELSMYDCGLREWLASQSQSRSVSHPRSQSQRTAQQTLHPLPVELGGVAPGVRHVSHGSLASQATFPIRSDAYTATDLSTRAIDVLPSSAPPPILPYPSLALAPIQRSPARSSILLSPTKSIPISLPGSKGPATGFFASLGRKTSIRKDRGGGLLSPQSPSKVLTKHRPQAIASSISQPAPSRPTPPPTTPSVPGGPRAAPGHIKRAKTYSVGPGISPAPVPMSTSTAAAPAPSAPQVSPSPPTASSSQSSPNNSQRQSTVPARRPSLFARARPAHTSVSPAKSSAMVPADPNFERQVDKLADLLPHAERSVLAGYLRRAGEDILAIGQYLEDEKNGTLRRE